MSWQRAYDDKGNPHGVRASIRDCTERVMAEQTLNSIVWHVPGMLYRCRNDENWTMDYVSPGCMEVTGRRREEFLNNSRLAYGQLIAAQDRGRVQKTVQNALAKREGFEIEYSISTPDGRSKMVWECGRGIFDEGGNLMHIEGFITDLKKNNAKSRPQGPPGQ